MMEQDIIRRAAGQDEDRLVELGLFFARKSQSVHTFEPSETRVRETVHNAIHNPESIFFVLERGGHIEAFVLGWVTRVFFSEESVAQEMAFFSCVSGGMKLLDAFEDEARERGVKKIVVGCKPAFCDLGLIYNHRGYKLLEEQYIKTEG